MGDNILKCDDKFEKLMAEILTNNLGDKLGKTPDDKPVFMNEKEKGQANIFYKYMDFKNTYESIKNYPIYIDSFPFFPEVSKIDYLKFIYTAYLNEIYMLQERIKALTPMLKRSLKSCEGDSMFMKDYADLKKITNSASIGFDSIKKIRGEHVHQERYDTTELNEAAMYEFVWSSDPKSSTNIEFWMHNLVTAQQSKYKELIENDIVNITKIIDSYTKAIQKFLFEQGYIEKVAYNRVKRQRKYDDMNR